MNDYSKRSKFYRYEFTTKDDFSIIRHLLSLGTGPVIEIPCGAGRLLNVHAQHEREVYMVDLEPRMIESCQQQILEKQQTSRIYSVVGNMKNWLSPKKAELVLIPRGGLQLLNTREEVQQTLLNSNNNLIENGLIFVDIADAWDSIEENQAFLPEFMRFHHSRYLTGKSEFSLEGNDSLSRAYFSIRYETYISVRLEFKTSLSDQPTYHASYRWSRIKLDDLIADITSAGFMIEKIYGGYTFQDYEPGASRILCIAQKRRHF